VAGLVAVVVHTSECDVKPVPGLIPMPYGQAVETLRMMERADACQLDGIDLVTVEPDGTLGRYVSWCL
jgi:hypothetical protein